jgi:hypothetical protein
VAASGPSGYALLAVGLSGSIVVPVVRFLAFTPYRIQAAVFAGLCLSDWLQGGFGLVARELPLRIAVFAAFMAIAWFVRRRERTFR